MQVISLTRHRIALLTCVALGAFWSTAAAGRFQIPAGQEIKVKFEAGQPLSSGKLKKGDKVTITLAEPIVIATQTIVEAGAKGVAKVEDSKAAKPFKGGYLKVSFESLQPSGKFKAAKDAAVKLEGTVEKTGGNRPIFTVFPGLFGLLVKGGQGKVSPDEVYTAKVKEAIILESK